jgi:hypothetical protein
MARIFELEIFLIVEAIGAALDDTDFVVEPLDEAESDFVSRPVVSATAGKAPIHAIERKSPATLSDCLIDPTCSHRGSPPSPLQCG